MEQSKNRVVSLSFWTLALFTLLRVFFWASPEHQAKMTPVYLWPLCLIVCAFLAVCFRSELSRQAKVSMLLAVWLGATTFVNGDYYLQYNLAFLYGIVTTFGLCFPLATLCEKREDAIYRAILFFACIASLISLLALFQIATGTEIRSPFSGETLRVSMNRLFVFNQHPNEIGCVLTLGFACWAALTFRQKKLWQRLLCALGGIVDYAAAMCCVSKTVALTTSCILAIGLALWLIGLLRRAPLWGRALALVLCAAVAVLSCQTLLGHTVDLQSAFRSDGQELGETGEQWISESDAATEAGEESDGLTDETLAPRSLFENFTNFTGRTSIWKKGVEYLRERPLTLLLGATDAQVSRIPKNLLGWDVYHMHNVFVEILMLGGVPGLAMFLYLAFSSVAAALRLFFGRETENWKRMLALAVPASLCTGLMEIYPGVSGNLSDYAGLFLLGAVIALGGKGAAAEKQSESRVG